VCDRGSFCDEKKLLARGVKLLLLPFRGSPKHLTLAHVVYMKKGLEIRTALASLFFLLMHRNSFAEDSCRRSSSRGRRRQACHGHGVCLRGSLFHFLGRATHGRDGDYGPRKYVK
jgi:hypothetical protein